MDQASVAVENPPTLYSEGTGMIAANSAPALCPVVDSRPGNPTDMTFPERRRFERVACWLEARLRAVSLLGGDERFGMVCDVSDGGLGIRTEAWFRPYTMLAVQFDEADGGAVCMVRVVRVIRHPAGGWLLGCAFLAEPHAEP
jgi:hypothetical protein